MVHLILSCTFDPHLPFLPYVYPMLLHHSSSLQPCLFSLLSPFVLLIFLGFMSLTRAFLGSILLAFMILHLVDAQRKNDDHQNAATIEGRRSLLATIDCNGECSRRCQLSSRGKVCMRACGSCCAKCNCVPPGTSGNKEKCPCYNNLTTHGGKKKCP